MYSLQPEIRELPETNLVGIKTKMSFVLNTTPELWRKFMPRRGEIKDVSGQELYSVEIYGDDFFDEFDPSKEYEKWAAVAVPDHNEIPEGMQRLRIKKGSYAIFHYRGKPSEAKEIYRHIYSSWIPNSEYELDNRPQFAVMGAKYKGEHPDSEEEIWIPVKRKSEH